MGPGVVILSEYRPVLMRGAEAERLLLGMVEARKLGLRGGLGLTAEQRRERARKASRARWERKRAER